MHAQMYSDGGVGEKCEVYNFAKPGGTIEFVERTFPAQLEYYGNGGENIVLLSIGGNDSKAEDEPNNFVCTPEEFTQKIQKLLARLKEQVRKVVVVSNWYVDETKTNPKANPLTGGKSYFTNERRMQFNGITEQACKELGITYITPAVEKDEWLQNYLYADGLHPNQAGYQIIFDKVKQHLPKLDA